MPRQPRFDNAKAVLVTLAIAMVAIFALPLIGLILGASWQDVVDAIADKEVLQAIGLSLSCAFTAIASTLVLSVSLGHAIARRRLPLPGLWSAFVELLVVVPHPLIGLGLLLLFARNRLLGAALNQGLGIAVEGAIPGICLAMVIVAAPSLVKTSRDAFRRTPKVMLDVAESLGARPWRRFFTIELPLAWPGIRSGAVLAWARAVSEFGAIGIIAYYPRTAPVLIWDRFTTYGLQSAIAPSLVLVVIAIITLSLVHWSEVHYASYEEIER